MAEKGKIKQAGKARGRAKSDGRTVQDVMTPEPVSLLSIATVADAAQAMRDNDIGDVVVLDDTTARLCGIVTDRDLVVRAVAEGKDPSSTTLASICSSELHCVTREDSVDDVIRLMREHAVRRVPVVEGDKPVGIVSIGDLAVDRDPRSALADISAAPANE
jgi:CBS domain-containing protein